MLKFLTKLILIVPFVFIYSCSSKNTVLEEPSNHLEYVDSYGRVVYIPQNPKRIVSVSPGITEIICSLHSENRLVGRSDFCKYPASVSSIESVGGISNVNIEKIFSLYPDLVLIGSMVPKQTVEILSNGGIPVVAIKEEQEFIGVYKNIHVIGKILGKENIADSLVASIKKQLTQIEHSSKNELLLPSVYYVVGYGQAGDFTAGKNTHINDIIRLAGGRNIAEDSQTWSFSRELLFERNPDYIFVRAEDFEGFYNTFPYTDLKAVKNKKVFPIESSWMDVLGPRSVNAILYIHEKIYSK